METVSTKVSLQQLLALPRSQGQRIAFVPTMGALHKGHLALVTQARQLADIVVCSIFVNPTQFNDPKDLEKYPRPIERDTSLLEEVHCDVLFHPAVDEIYGAEGTEGDSPFDLGHLEQVLEGLHRPGHFQGVTQVLRKLFDAVQPDVACFGQKDFQQYKVVEYMVDQLKLPLRLELCPTIREPGGLAMSSRNVRLTPEGRKQALQLYRILQHTKADLQRKSMDALRADAIKALNDSPGIRVEYFEIFEAESFTAADETSRDRQLVALAAIWVDGVRLIDNLFL
ncbi:pantoate--beta-alanine ligase [Parapedobacter sp. 10938]|uniref:pantoate--beta-alanine ligase n=1 Tax=Parapedobacter flavus TaxID=3110225 RepID=UPI002DBBBFF6|nr:pantoate--beta-alanine ligase [Parapedobacter sp. 10938]MEC3880502.1 pantoate--beta-alanine ligase [Parapedobacter sp. 10938]